MRLNNNIKQKNYNSLTLFSRAPSSSLSQPHSELVIAALQQAFASIPAGSQASGNTKSQSDWRDILDSYISTLHTILSHQSNSKLLDLLLELFFRPETTASASVLALPSLRAAMASQKHHVLLWSSEKMCASSDPEEILSYLIHLCPGEVFSEKKQFLSDNIHNILPTVLLQAGNTDLTSGAEQTLVTISR